MVQRKQIKPIYIGPVSVKGIVFEDGKVWLRKNERQEWELPGGKIDIGEQPEETVIREIEEELGFDAEIVNLVDAHMHTIMIPNKKPEDVLVISYLCKIKKRVSDFEYDYGGDNKAEFEKFSLKEVDKLNMPEFYKEAIKKANENH